MTATTTLQTPPESLPGAPQPGLEQAVDFVNTTGLTRGRPFDELGDAEALLAWLRGAGYLSESEQSAEGARLVADPRAAGSAIARMRAMRAGLRDLFDAEAEERAPTSASLKAVNAALRVSECPELVTDGGRVRLTLRCGAHPLDRALAAIARAVAEELSEGRPDRFRVCENPTCRWAFVDRSRPGTRRWCEMSSCGNRMKAARHRARLRGETIES